MKSTSLFSAAASFVLAASPAVAWTVGQGVDTSSGTVIGHAASLDSSVSEYLGIPWAAPPVGALRWQPPQPFPKSATPLKADVFSPDCVQSRGSGGSRNLTGIQAGVLANLSGGKSISEDCLTLNIWTKPQSGEKKKAVLVWVYGGGFSTGSTASSSYNGVKFAGNQDVVLVSINYRLMIMGFPAAPALFDNVNLGLIDQRSALFWIKNNIAAFGGDPDRITLFGESAGGRSVDIYAYAWANETDPIVNGFIAQSGAAPQNTGWTPRPNSWFELARRSGCGAAKGKESVECMRTKSVDVIMQALGTDGGKRADLMRAFTPVTDGKTYFSDYDKRAEAGQFIKKPLFTGNNDNEAGLSAFVLSLQGKTMSAEQQKSTNAGYNCQAKIACDRRRTAKLPVWRYRWLAQFPNQRLTAKSGAWHGSEIPSVFGLVDNIRGASAVSEQISLSKYMNNAWAEFARDPEKGLSKLGLPQWDPQTNSLILFGETGAKNGVSFAKSEKFDGECAALKNTLPGLPE